VRFESYFSVAASTGAGGGQKIQEQREG